MANERQPSRAAKVAAGIIVSLFTLLLFALTWILVRAGIKDATNKTPLTHWLYWCGAAVTLVLGLISASGIYTTWFPKALVTGPLERRGSPLMNEVRDDGFERQLDWMRNHKRLIKAIEGVAIAILLLILFLFSLNY